MQKRGEKSDAPAPNLRLRIAFGALRYEISASAQSTFGKNDIDLPFRILLFYFFCFLFGFQENGGKNKNYHSIFSLTKHTTNDHKSLCYFDRIPSELLNVMLLICQHIIVCG